MMKSDNLESNESTEVDRDRRNRELNEKKKFEMEMVTIAFGSEAKIKDSRWDNLIFIDVAFYINDFLFKEEFLWDKRINSPSEIKEFCCYLLRENTMNKDKNFACLCEGINRFSYDFLECRKYFLLLGCAEFMTKKILEEIKFYERFHPYDLFKEGIFGPGGGIDNEHLINISLDLADESLTYKDSFQWDIINDDNIPEDFARTIVTEYLLPTEFVNLIALNIRKQIKEHVFSTMSSLTDIFVNLKENLYEKSQSNLKESLIIGGVLQDSATKKSHIEEKKANSLNTRTLFATYNTNSSIVLKNKLILKPNSEISKSNKIDNKLNRVVPFLFEYKLENQLGRKISRHSNKEAKPYFIRNQLKKKEKKHKTLGHHSTINEKIYSKDIPLKIDIGDSNEHVTIENVNKIIISKEILKYSDYYEIIAIEKNKIREYLTDLNI